MSTVTIHEQTAVPQPVQVAVSRRTTGAAHAAQSFARSTAAVSIAAALTWPKPRMASPPTDAPLAADPPFESSRCGVCTLCRDQTRDRTVALKRSGSGRR